jgi:uncharacterized membrane protein YfcA
VLNSIPFSIFIGVLCGFLAGVGVGGGSILMLWLTTILHTEPQIARAINLMFFVPAALSVSIFRWKQGSLSHPGILPAMISGCAAAVLGCYTSKELNQELLQKFFGGLLIITGIRELFYLRRKAR